MIVGIKCIARYVIPISSRAVSLPLDCFITLRLQHFSSIPKFLINDFLRIPHGSLFSSIPKLILAFAISSWGHAAGDYGIFRGKRWFAPRYFGIHLCALTLETLVLALVSRLGGGDLGKRYPSVTRWVGYVWVGSVLCASAPEFAMGFLIPMTGADINSRFS